MEKDNTMLYGSPAKKIFFFAMPLIMGNIFQQLYTFFDTVIVGRMIGMDALAAVGTTEWLSFLMFGMIQGITQGFSVFIAQKYGAGDYKSVRRGVSNSIYLSLFGAFLFVIAGQSLIMPLLQLLKTPNEIIEMSGCYLSVLYYGVPVSFLYNLFAAVLRALGNSKTPLIAITVSSIVNIVLDYVFVKWFDAGVFGVAFATVLAQVISMLICIHKLRGYTVLKFEDDDRKPCIEICKEQLRLGVPMGIQNIITSIGGLVVQSVVNGFGVIFIAAYTAATKLYGLLETAASSYSYAVSTYVGQNYGAKEIKRVRMGLKAASGIGIVTALVMSAIMLLGGKEILNLFIGGEIENTQQAIEIGYQYLKILAVFFPLLYLLYIWRACIQGLGNTVLPMLSSFMQLAMRVLCALVLTGYIGQQGVFWGEILAWLAADLFLAACYIRIMKTINIKCTM